GCQDRHSRCPPIAMTSAEERAIANDWSRIDTGLQLRDHRLADDERDVLRHPLREPSRPMGVAVEKGTDRRDEDLPVAHLDRRARHIVGPEIERAPTGHVETRVMPVA